MSTQLFNSPHDISAREGVGPFSVSVSEDGGVISEAIYKFGFQHRGIEKLFQGLNFSQAMSYCDRIDFSAAPFCNFVFAQAVERLGKMVLPPKAHHGRVVLLELSRIFSHLYFVGRIARAGGHEPVFNFAVREREKISNLFEMFCGSRLGFGAICIGGIAADTTDGWLYQVERALGEISSFLEEVEDYLLLNPLFVARLQGLMTLSPAKAQEAGITGPNLRACGVDVDLRRAQPGVSYDSMTIQSVGGPRLGDAFSRVMLRLAEIRQSEQIIRAAITQIPSGNFRILIGPNIFLPAGAVSSRVEGPRGELGMFLLGGGENRPLRAKFFTPSCAIAEILPELSEGVCLDDLFLGLHSLDVQPSEIDR